MEGIKKSKLRDLLVKRPFVRTLPDGAYLHGEITGKVDMRPVPKDTIRYKIVTQEDFMRELDPLGHAINDKNLYPDIWRQNDEDGRWYVEEIPRYAIALQQIIRLKHLTHLCGNDIRFELSDKTVSDEKTSIYNDFVAGWAIKNMEVAWYKFCKSVKSTGDAAVVGFMDNGKFGWKVLSFMDGDVLYPHYDKYTGRMNVFARRFSDYDDKGEAVKEFVEVWDDDYYYRFAKDLKGDNSFQDLALRVLKMFSLNGYELEEAKPHNFESIPVSYHRCEYGPCWTFSQETIESYEIAFSNLAQSNHDFGLPIMYIKGEGSQEITGNELSYASKVMLLPSDGEMGFLNRQDASAAYKTELDALEEWSYKQSFAVKTPELKSGDTPGVSLKIMYSDAYENAMDDSHEYDSALDKLVEIFSFGYGVECGRQLAFKNTNIRHYIEPYIHLNVTELTTNLNTSVTGGFLSKQTAAEKSPYSTPNEWERIQREKKEEQMQEMLLQEQKIEIQNDANVEMQDELADIEVRKETELVEAQGEGVSEESSEKTKKEQSGRVKRKHSVATGRGGRPARKGVRWDSNGNEIDPLTGKAKSKWDNWNMNH